MIPTWGQPRLCGEHDRGGVVAHELYRTTPFMRVTRRSIRTAGAHQRFTPAHAGNTVTHTKKRQNGRVHPRTCGEYAPASVGGVVAVGSPPHMRGTLNIDVGHGHLWRFTPAHAGNTLAETAISSQHTKNFNSHTLQLLLQRNTADLQHRNTSSPKLTHSDQYTTTYIKRASTALIPRGRNPST